MLLMPVHTPPHKPAGDGDWGARDPGPRHRLRMCELTADAHRGLRACALEIERGGASYTVDTLRGIHASHPHARLTFVVGADTACTLASWREPAELLALADLAVAAREGSDPGLVLDTLAALDPGGPSARVRFLQMPPIDVSSSLARQRAARGEPLEQLVGPAVAAYIAEHRLYGWPARAAARPDTAPIA